VSAIVNAFLERDEERVCLLHRAPDGRLLVHRAPADYAIYLRKDEVPDDVRRAWRRDPLCRGYRVEGEWLRTRWRSWQGRREKVQSLLDKGITPYEGDVSPVKRWLADHPDVQIQRPRRVYLDLETDSRVRIRDAKEGEARVLVWSLVDEEGRSNWGCLAEDTDQAERMLLQGLYRALASFDQVCSWNGDDFDFPVLKERTKRRKIDVGVLRRWLWMDHMLLFERMNMQVAQSGEEKQSKALDAVAWAQLGDGKDPFDARRTYDAWASGGEERDRLVRYCVRDADLMRRIEVKTGYLALHQTIAEVCGLFDDTWALRPTAQMDAFLLRLGRKRGQHFPTVFRSEEPVEATQYRGSYNKFPPEKAGVLQDVHVVDFSSMYPSIMISWNMSWETVVDGPVNGSIPPGMCRAPKTGVCFRTDVTGLVPESCEYFLAMRKEWSAKRADMAPGTPEALDAERYTNTFKVEPNAFYGAQGNAGCRFHRRSVAESVSQTGAWLAKKTEHALTERYPGAEIIYVDTDGLWIVGMSREQVDEAVAWLNEEVYPRLLRECGCVKNIVKLAYEKQFARVVFVKAKTYCNPPEAPVWMGDLSFKKLGDVKVGDEVVGWREGTSEKRRKLTKSIVAEVHRHRAEIVKLTMASGRTIRCTPDHEWLRARMLKLVRTKMGRREYVFGEGKLGKGENMRTYRYLYGRAREGLDLVHVIDEPASLQDEKLKEYAAWLGGIWDGEGSLCSGNRGQIIISQSPSHNPEVCARIEVVLRALGFDYGTWKSKRREGQNPVNVYALRGKDKQHKVDFLHWCRPAKAAHLQPAVLKTKFGKPDRVVRIEPDGVDEVVGLTTTTGNYVAWGYASKNCGRYAHYKGKAADARSRPEIKGIAYKRGDQAKLTMHLQAEAIDLLMGGMRELSCGCGHEYALGAREEVCPTCGKPRSRLAKVQGPTDEVAHYEEMLLRWRALVMEGELSVEQVQVVKGISRPLGEYASKKTAKGKDSTQPPHVRVGKMLEARGEDVGEGTRIAYVVVDGDATPQGVIPACDYRGECDRRHLWGDVVYAPTQRLLKAAFPHHDWKQFGPPKKERKKKGKGTEVQQELGGIE
jgi:DNA polymerase elongation subunit (family B)